MADLQRKSYNLFDKSQISIITTPIGDRYGSIFESAVGTYTLDVTGTANSGDYLYADKVLSDGTSGARYYIVNNGTKTTIQLTISNDGEKFLIYNASGDNLAASQAKFDRWLIMLNSGNTAKPYEPYGWVHSLRKLTTATEAVENPLYSDGTAITSYTIKGNEEHTGTPSPSNPVMPNGTGDRTDNLWNEAYTGISSSSVTYFPIYVGSGDFTLSTTARKTESLNPSQNGNANIFFLTGNVSSGASTSGNGVWNGQNRTVTATDGYVTIAYRYLVDDSGSDPRDNDTMLNTGSTAKSYEPYGYKIPILTSEGSAVNYLGSVPSNRQIYKLVLDGTENYGKDSGGTYLYYKAVNPTHAKIEQCLCTHLPNASDYPRDSVGIYATKWANNAIYFNFGAAVMDAQPSGNTTTGLKEYLAAQYAAGTPVTIWYILETPTTGIVNEPLMKISTYADTLSNATAIPTTEGANSITVDTTVQPSEFTATWTGWHDSSVQEYRGGVGNQKFDKSTAALGYRVLYTTGEIGELSTTFCSDFIPVVPNTTYTLNVVGNLAAKTGHLYALYDSDKEFVDTGTHASVSDKYVYTFTIPSGIAYIRFNGLIANIDETMLNEGETVLPYEPYEYGWV